MTILLAMALAGAVPMSVATEVEAPGPLGPLKATMLAPADAPRAPIVLIVPGSGPTDRDGNNPLIGKPASLRLLAEGLAANGIASVRIDKRGMFGSKAAITDANRVTIGDYAADVAAWVAAIRKQTGAPCLWVLGHSEGGLVALAGAHAEGVCGLVLMATPGRPLGEVLREQLTANPANAPILPQALPAVDALEAGKTVDVSTFHPALQQLFNPAVQPYFIDLMRYDPAKLIAAAGKPVLIVQGMRDVQIAGKDAEALKAADPAARLVMMPNMNHVLKPVASDDRAATVATYGDPNLPLAPGLVEAVAAFVKEG